jgi:hypothetical protein
MIRFNNPHKMRLSQPICKVSLKKWGLYISYGQVYETTTKRKPTDKRTAIGQL